MYGCISDNATNGKCFTFMGPERFTVIKVRKGKPVILFYTFSFHIKNNKIFN